MADINVIAIVKVKDGSEDDVRAAMTTLVRATREEAGCLAYDLLESTTTSPATFVTVERWKDQDAIEAHMKSDHLQQAQAAAGPNVDGEPVLLILSAVDVG